jgi:hypothetical protein
VDLSVQISEICGKKIWQLAAAGDSNPKSAITKSSHFQIIKSKNHSIKNSQ